MIVLDLDGPVLDTRWRHYHCYSAILTTAGDEPLSQERYWQAKRRGTTRSELLAMTDSDHLDGAFAATWLESIESEESLRLDGIQPGAVDVLFEWQGRGVEPTLVTARRDAQALHGQLDRLGLTPLLSRVVRTPWAHTGELKASALRERVPDEPIGFWIGDTVVDVDAAKRVEARAVAVTCGLREREYLARLEPWLLVRDLREAAAHPALSGSMSLTNHGAAS